MTVKLYGIANCDTIKKARRWLEANGVDYNFHNYKKSGVPEKELRQWVKKLGWETLLNKRGTTWRRLEDKLKNNLNQAAAIKLMLANPSMIKRPVLLSKTEIFVGFDTENYQSLK